MPLSLVGAVTELTLEEQAMLDEEDGKTKPLPAAATLVKETAPAPDPFSMLDDEESPRTQPGEGDSGGQPMPPEPDRLQTPPQPSP